MHDVVIIGGGLAGLTSSIELALRGYSVLVVERKTYPFHRVCGEYVSNEVKPYLQRLGLNLNTLNVQSIHRFRFTSPSGKALDTPLDLGGFGVSRYTLDFALYQLAQNVGVQFLLGGSVVNPPTCDGDVYEMSTDGGIKLKAKIVLGAFGKNSRMDKTLDRDFT
ncbi:MAG: FAD-dependent oxidoreductase, partial [Spirosomaceae bacterium]|nr:FAD-dependent oxidoreductase [Spirosomataceae bacterium]